MALLTFDTLFARADQRQIGLGVAVAGAADPTILEALREATDRGWVRPLLFGDAKVMDDLGISTAGMSICDQADPAQAAHAAVAAIHAGQAQLLMKGQIATPTLMGAVLAREGGLRTGRVIAQVVLMEIPRDQRRFLLADTGITPRPTLDQKRDLLHSMVAIAHQLGEPNPRVAVMAASEKVTDALPDTHEAAALAGECWTGCVVQGPLSFDLAYAPEAGQRKGIGGEVTGAADALLFPDLSSANLTVKAIMYTADCRFGGVLVGTRVPVVFMSRADDTPTRLRSLAYALRVADPSPA